MVPRPPQQWASKRKPVSKPASKQDGQSKQAKGKQQAVGRQAIHYDGQTWEGRIESMSYTLEESRQNGGISFDLSFTVYNHKFNDPMEANVVDRLKNLNSSEEVR